MANRSFILLIFGVKLDDVRNAIERSNISSKQNVDKQATAADIDRSKTTYPQSLIDYANYMTLPRVFVNLDAHPKTTNLLCWHCSLLFSCVPKFIPIESIRTGSSVIDGRVQDRYEWSIDGNFCSWACVAAYIEEHYSEQKKWTLNQNLAIIRAQIEEMPIRHVPCAPSRTKMQSYCGAGGISQQEYLELLETLSRDQKSLR